jgi:hypothetical protein
MKLNFFACQILRFEVYMVVEIQITDVWVMTRHSFCGWLPTFLGNLLPPCQDRNAPSVLKMEAIKFLQNTDNHYTVFNPTNCTCNHKYLLFCDAYPTCFGPCRPSAGRSFTKEYIYTKCCPRCEIKIQC